MKRIGKWLMVLILCTGCYIFWPTKPTESQLNHLIRQSRNEQLSNSGTAVLIDYSKPVFKKRLWLIDLNSKKVLLNCHVSHAKKSGIFWPTVYSNKVGSELSCTGRFKTLHTYESNYGKGVYKVGLRIAGLDQNNDNAFRRNIVFHTSFPLWSKGCFMTSERKNKFIADHVEEGSLLLVLE